MLQRAASNAYSWWWASHIRTTQSKWLDANLQDMEHRVKIMLKLLGEEADSFGKRAEMYYRRRPEVINHVEEVYRAYRALVERYDHLSKELHKANHTIATACPEEVQYAMLEEEDANFPRAIMPINSRKIQKSTVEEILKRKREGSSDQRKGMHERSVPHMSKGKAEEEIGRLQKAILVMQTEKEFVKSSYETGVARYWEIEKQIADMQEEICHMQDEFDAHADIDDDEARALMTITAIRSCQGTVAKFVEYFEESIRTAKMESETIMSLQEKLYAMTRNIDPSKEVGITDMTSNNRLYPITQKILELQPIYEKIEIFFDNNPESSAEEMAHKVDELVDKIINLELQFPKQSAQIKQMKEENKKIKNKLDDLQDDMALRDDPSDSSEELKLVQDELNRIRVLEGSIIEDEVHISTEISEVFSCLINISKTFGPVDPEDLDGLSGLATDWAIPCEGVRIENLTKGNTAMNGGGSRDIEAVATNDNLGRDGSRKLDVSEVIEHNSSHPTDGVHDFKNGYEKHFLTENCSMQEEYRDKRSKQVGNHIHLIASSDNENGPYTCDGTAESSSSDSPIIASHTDLLPLESNNNLNSKSDSNGEGSSAEVTESSFGGGNRIQDFKIDGDENSTLRDSLIQEEGLGAGDGKSRKTCEEIHLAGSARLHSFNEQGISEINSLTEGISEMNSLTEAVHRYPAGAEENLDLRHADEAKLVEELPEQGDPLIAPEDIKGLNECSEFDSCEGQMSAYFSEVGGETSCCVPAGDSEETRGVYRVVSEIPTYSEDIARRSPRGQLAKKNTDVEVLAREANILSNHGSSSANILSNHGSRNRLENSTLVAQEDPPSWQEFLLNGIEGRDKILLADYTSVLRNYKETKRRLTELEKKNQEHLEDTKTVIRELKNANSMKYVDIQSLRNLLAFPEVPPSTMGTDRSNQSLDREISVVEEMNSSHTGAPNNSSPFEVKFRTEIDALVDDNLRLLARYSIAFHRMLDFSSKYQELHNEMENSEDKKTGGEHEVAAQPKLSEKKLRELRTELDVWIEQNALLDQDMQLKTASLCKLQEEIAEALHASTETDGARLIPYEAAKFQGEVLNMQQSNNKIESELLGALERVRELEGEVSQALRKLHESFELSSRRSSRLDADSSYQNQFKHFPSRTRVPLRNFLFGTKPKKKSLFACINPTYQRQFSDF